MKKRGISLLLTICMIVPLALPSTAYAQVNSEELKQKVDRIEEYEYEYEEIQVLTSENNNSSALNIEKIRSIEEINKKNIEIAKRGVIELDLKSKNLEFIEEACLTELEQLENDTDVVLNEYTVLVPKQKAATPTYFTKYKGRTYYSLVTSRSNQTVQKLKVSNKTKINSWLKNIASIGMMFDSSWVSTISGTVMSASLPSNYRVHNSDWADAYIQVNPKNRAIYAKKNGKFINLVNKEFGPVRPYVVYHANDATATKPTVTSWYSRKNYPNPTPGNSSDLLYNAKAIYDTGASPISFKLNKIVRLRWR
ncbi:MAG: hypothetical protein ACTHW2_10685 [Tissierella sp.]|uniref:hypothetical protein n=1 Tax=Tissierella sp. TaxID=41274 RepID=UPI003F99757C